LLKSYGFPVIKSWIFYEYKSAVEFSEKASYPLVFKLCSGAGSRMVRLIKNKYTAKKYIDLMFRTGISYEKGLPDEFFDIIKNKGISYFLKTKAANFFNRKKEGKFFINEDWQTHKNYILFQEFLPGNQYDTRVVTIGDRAFGFVRYNRKDDFRASGESNVNYDPKSIDLSFVELALKISKRFGFDTMAYDFLYDQDKNPAISEISYVYGGQRGSKISKCPGYWNQKMVWYEGRTSVAHGILSHILKMSDLKLPDGELS
jgi:glutathione synthase/RimK-type ligase-like ATP-grasp enzyme